MKKIILLTLILLPIAIQAQVSKDILAFFPKASTTKDIKGQWTEVLNSRNKTLGYVAYSKPASNGIRGYAGETPLIIAFGKDQKIIGVKPLPNNETPGYLNRVIASGLFDSWNGLTAKAALSKKVDAVSGATYTSNSVIKSLRARLKEM